MKSLKENLLRNVGVGKIQMIERWLIDHGINPGEYNINKDFTIDIEDFSIRGDFKALPEYIQFGKVNRFQVRDNKELISLQGFPNDVKYLLLIKCSKLRDFGYDTNSQIHSLTINNCDGITSLSSIPKNIVSHELLCRECKNLKTLKGCPQNLENFYCKKCDNLVSLEGCPQNLKNFSCRSCSNIRSLKGAPKKVEEEFNCCYCSNLETLKGAPEEVGDNFMCSYCYKLKTLEGAPKKVGGDFYCLGCLGNFNNYDVVEVCDVKGKVISKSS